MVYIYSLLCSITNEVRYVGKTVNMKARYYDHIYKSLTGHKSQVCKWIRSLITQGHQPIMSKIEMCPEDNWEEREKYWISKYDNLTNVHEGGKLNCHPILNPKKYSGCHYNGQKNGWVATGSYKRRRIYLGVFATKNEAHNAYLVFNESPDKYILSKKTLNTSGVKMYKDSLLVKEFNKIAECARHLNTAVSNISRCCKGKARTHKGHTFEYKMDRDNFFTTE